MSEIKAIETIYNGYRFRSRLEARWAVFFDALGINYEYEPEGFELPSGKRYLPDFKVKCYGTRGGFSEKDPFDLWIEVKGNMTEEDASRIKEFAGSVQHDEFISWYEIDNPVLIIGDVPNPENYYSSSDDFNNYKPMNDVDIYPWNYELIDGDYFAAYPAVKDGKFYLDGDDSNYQTQDISIIRNAFRKARQARFEHGETPTTGGFR